MTTMMTILNARGCVDDWARAFVTRRWTHDATRDGYRVRAMTRGDVMRDVTRDARRRGTMGLTKRCDDAIE